MAHILVADDGEVRGLLRAFLEAEEHQVTEAADGAEALRAVRTAAFDLVVCDVFMPGLDGLETLRQLRREFPRLRALVTSGQDKLGLVNAGGVLEAVWFLSKPFSPDDVRAAVKRALGQTVILTPPRPSGTSRRPARLQDLAGADE